MNELIKINYDSERPTVNGRDLHDALQVKSDYRHWFPRMCEYGFIEGKDFRSFLTESTGGRQAVNHQLTINMAKELCMIQRNEIGKKFRRYFIEVEEAWNSPEAIMARALNIANQELKALQNENIEIRETVAIQTQQIAEMQPKASYYDLVLNSKDTVSTTVVAKDYGWSAKKLNRYLHEKGVQFKQGNIWVLYQKYAEMGYTHTRTQTFLSNKGEPHTAVYTRWTQKGRLFIYDLLKSDGILPTIERCLAEEECGVDKEAVIG